MKTGHLPDCVLPDGAEPCKEYLELKRLCEVFNSLAVGHALAKQRLQDANTRIGKWLSAALEDPNCCAEMKADICAWFESQKL